MVLWVLFRVPTTTHFNKCCGYSKQHPQHHTTTHFVKMCCCGYSKQHPQHHTTTHFVNVVVVCHLWTIVHYPASCTSTHQLIMYINGWYTMSLFCHRIINRAENIEEGYYNSIVIRISIIQVFTWCAPKAWSTFRALTTVAANPLSSSFHIAIARKGQNPFRATVSSRANQYTQVILFILKLHYRIDTCHYM